MPMKHLAAGIGLVVLAAVCIVVIVRSDRQESGFGEAERAAHNPQPPGPRELPVLWDAPAFAFTDQDGRPFGSDQLRGHVWISDFFFTSCTSICPMMTARMRELARTIARPGVRFVSFSVDPGRDTQAILRQYADLWAVDGSRWRLLRTDADGLMATAKGMKVFVKPPDPDGSVQHSGLFVLTDQEGRVRGVYDSGETESLQRLVRDALSLDGAPGAEIPRLASEPAVPEAADETGRPGRVLFVSAGCAACHSQARVAPALGGRMGGRVALEGGGSAVFDDAYVRESILDPNAKIAAGYPRMMPSYRGQLTDAQVTQLAAYIETMKPEAPSAGASPGGAKAEAAVDPVCGMAVVADANPLRQLYAGRIYYFCSPACRDRFQQRPEAFAVK